MISVIVPVYNTKIEYLEQCINSILNQSYQNIQLLIVDDGSDSYYAEALDVYSKKDSRCMVFHVPQGGVSHARNYGLDKAEGEYVAFVDSDDWVSENFLETLLQKIEDVNLAMMASSSYYETKRSFADETETNQTDTCVDRKHIFEVLYGCTNDAQKWKLNSVWAKLYRMELIREGNIRFDTSLSRLEDGVFNLLYLTFQKEKISCYYSDTVGYYVRQHSNSTVHKYNPNLAEDMLLPLKRMYEISVQSGTYDEDKTALAYRALLNAIVFINDGACGNKNSLRMSVKETKNSIKADILKNLIAECEMTHLNCTESMVARSIQQGNAWKPTLYFWLRRRIKH